MRRDKINYYLDIAEVVTERGTCLRRNFGAIVVKHDEIVSTGYTGAPRGRSNCTDLGVCKRQRLQIPRGQRYEMCRSVHAEANAIISAARSELIGATIYLVGKEVPSQVSQEKENPSCQGEENPAGAQVEYVKNTDSCAMCKRLIINAGIEKVVVRTNKSDFVTYDVQQWIDDDDIELTEGY